MYKCLSREHGMQVCHPLKTLASGKQQARRTVSLLITAREGSRAAQVLKVHLSAFTLRYRYTGRNNYIKVYNKAGRC